MTEDQAKVQTASPEELERVEEGATAKPQIPKTGEVVSGKGSTEPGKREGIVPSLSTPQMNNALHRALEDNQKDST